MMNLLEYLTCISIMAILACTGFYQYQSQVRRHDVARDTRTVTAALTQARTLHGSAHCDASLCQVQAQGLILDYPLSGKTDVVQQMFPSHLTDWTFGMDGTTLFQNGTIYLSHLQDKSLQKKIVVSQGGRVTVI